MHVVYHDWQCPKRDGQCNLPMFSFLSKYLPARYRGMPSGLVLTAVTSFSRSFTTVASFNRPSSVLDTHVGPEGAMISTALYSVSSYSKPRCELGILPPHTPGETLAILCVLEMRCPQGYVFHNFCLERVLFQAQQSGKGCVFIQV